MKSDRELQIDVLEELRWEPGVKATDIAATVRDGVVTLEGTVDSFAEKWAAEKAVKRLPGVKALAVEIEVELPGSSERTDTDIAAAAEHALKWDILVPHDRVKVTAENGRLTLEGEVDRQFQIFVIDEVAMRQQLRRQGRTHQRIFTLVHPPETGRYRA